MTVEDALRTLGLTRGATEATIKEAYRTKAFEAHPDAGGDDATFARLLEARNTLIEARQIAVVENRVQDLVRKFERNEALSESERELWRTMSATTSSLRAHQNRALWFALLTAACTMASQSAKMIFADANDGFGSAVNIFAVVTILAGLIGAIFTFQISRTKAMIEDFGSSLSRKAAVRRLLMAVLAGDEDTDGSSSFAMTKDEWMEKVKAWLDAPTGSPAHTIRHTFIFSDSTRGGTDFRYVGMIIGHYEFAEVLRLKAVSAGLARESEWDEDEIEFNVR